MNRLEPYTDAARGIAGCEPHDLRPIAREFASAFDRTTSWPTHRIRTFLMSRWIEAPKPSRKPETGR